MPPLRGSPSEYFRPILCGKLERWGYPVVKNFKDMYNRLDTIPACDRQTEGRTDILPRAAIKGVLLFIHIHMCTQI